MALLKLALSLCLAVHLVSAWCPEGTDLERLTRHYGGFCYSIATTELTWRDAHTKCRNSSGDGQLLKLETESLWYRLRSWISYRTIWTAGHTHGVQEVTSSPTDSPVSAVNQTWYWTDSKTPDVVGDVANIRWRNFSEQVGGPCLALAPTGWKAMNCSSRQSTVCQYPCIKYINSSQSTIQSPNYPSFYPANTNCEWVINVGQGQAVIHFKNFRLEGSQSDCSYDYLEIYERKDSYRYLAKLCGPILPTHRIVSPSQHMYIKMVTDGYDQYSGFTAEVRSTLIPTESVIQTAHGVITTPEFPELYPSNASLAWLIDVETGSINMRFTDFDIQPGNGSQCTHDFLTVRKGGRDGDVLGTFCGSTLPADINSSSAILHLTFRSDASTTRSGFRAIFWSSEETCFHIRNEGGGVITSPGYPANYIGKCVWYINVLEGVAKLNNLDMPLSDVLHWRSFGRYSDPHLVRYSHYSSYCSTLRIKISDGRMYTTNTVPIQDMCGLFSRNATSGSQYITLEFVGGFRSLHVMVMAMSPPRVHASFRSSKNCSYMMKSVTGVLTSPEYPSSYDPHANCSWLIDVLEGNATLRFDDFMFEEHDGCEKDRFEIYDGNSTDHSKIGHFCGHNSPGEVTASGRFLFLTMVSDATHGSRGFSAQFWSSEYECTQWGVDGTESVKINGDCYGLLKSRKTWSNARQYCESQNTSLVRFDSKEEFEALKWWIYNSTQLDSTSKVWTAGYRRVSNSSRWLWSLIDGDKLIKNWKSDLPWSPGYPDSNDHISISVDGLSTTVTYISLYTLCQVKSDNNQANHPADSCLSPPSISRGYYVPRGPFFPHNTTLVYSCRRGYQPVGGNNLTCLYGRWRYSYPSCMAISTLSPSIPTVSPEPCQALKIPHSSFNNQSIYPHGSELHVECDDGYTLEDKGEMLCVNGTWVGSLPYCGINKHSAKTSKHVSSSENSRYSTLVAITVPIIVILTLIIVIAAFYQIYTKHRSHPRSNPLLAMSYQQQDDEFPYE